MARLPRPNGDSDHRGTFPKHLLHVAHREDGTLRQHMQTINVRDFGAVGDGHTPDTAAFQRAIDGSVLLGGMVFVPPGIYVLSAALALPSNIELRGAGPGLTIVSATFLN